MQPRGELSSLLNRKKEGNSVKKIMHVELLSETLTTEYRYTVFVSFTRRQITVFHIAP